MTEPCPYVSRGGLKLEAAIEGFDIDVANRRCVDLGCNIGGFTDCLLQRDAAHVFAVDTGYGTLDWKLRKDERVTVLERTNALHFEPSSLDGFVPCTLAVIDLGWTTQRHALPAALRWLETGNPDSRIISLIKPHYEQGERSRGQSRAILSDEQAETVLFEVLAAMPSLDVDVLGHVRSPIRGGGKRGKPGNVEYLALLRRAD